MKIELSLSLFPPFPLLTFYCYYIVHPSDLLPPVSPSIYFQVAYVTACRPQPVLHPSTHLTPSPPFHPLGVPCRCWCVIRYITTIAHDTPHTPVHQSSNIIKLPPLPSLRTSITMYLSSKRRSGHGPSFTTTDIKKAVPASETSQSSSNRIKSSSSSSRPSMTRRSTTQSSTHKSGTRSSRDREREWEREQEHWYEEQRESFPQYCMSCEKQFVPQDDRFLYCSEACRVHDHTHSTPAPSKSSSRSYAGPVSYASANYPYYSAEYSESRDIIPRASPSRPSSMHYSPPATSYNGATLSALRSLSIQDDSPPSPSMAGAYHSYNPSATAHGTSYSSRPTPKKGYSSTYDNSTYHADYSDVTTHDRPLPRRATTYSRPKSIELVTPMVSR